MKPGDILERKHKNQDLYPDFYRVMRLTASGKSVRAQPCDEKGSGLLGRPIATIRAWRVPLDFTVRAVAP